MPKLLGLIFGTIFPNGLLDVIGDYCNAATGDHPNRVIEDYPNLCITRIFVHQ